MLNLDTHILLYALDGTTLTRRERGLLQRHEWCISAIVLWELAKLFQLGRIKVDINHKEFQSTLESIRVLPVDTAVCLAIAKLDIQNDPADEIIAATSLAYKIPLLTRDRKLLGSQIVPLA